MKEFSKTPFVNLSPEPASGMGICRLVVQLEGEKVLNVSPDIGFSHRGIEKLIENANFFQALVLMDKVNPLNPFATGHCFLMSIERLLSIEPVKRASFIRVLLLELSRILSHLHFVSNIATDTGSSSVSVIIGKTAEYILSLLSLICKNRPFNSCFCLGGVYHDVDTQALDKIKQFINVDLPLVLSEIESLLLNNSVFQSRTVGLGEIKDEQALLWGFTGVNLRASNVAWDLRVSEKYEAYEELDFDILTRKTGDCFARFELRLAEIKQSMSLICQAIDKMPKGDVSIKEFHPSKNLETLTGQSLHFEQYVNGLKFPKGAFYTATETALGEFGVYLDSIGDETLHRCHLRSAGFSCLQALDDLVKGKNLSDVRPILSSLNIIMTEVDR